MIIKILLSDLHDNRVNRPEGYLDEILAVGRIETVEIVILDGDVYQKLVQKFTPKPKPVQPIPRKEWPIWAKALSKFAKSEDKGIGDIAARTIGAENSEAFKKWYKATTGKDCGCTGRQKRWNIEYPLNSKATLSDSRFSH